MTRHRSLLRHRKALLLVVLTACLGLVPAASSAGADGVTITATIEGIDGANGWYRGSAGGDYVVVHWSVSGPVASTTNCEVATRVDGPTAGTRRTCTAEASDGTTVSSTTKLIKIDADPPTGVAAVPSRPPDANGWYNHAVAIGWHGSDATSGIAGCSTVTYSGPDAAPASVSGTCTDAAGNSASSSFSLLYDATPPTVRSVSVASEDNADVVRWTSSAAGDTAVVTRAARGSRARRVVFRGGGNTFADHSISPGLEYRYSVQTFDQAGNAGRAVTTVALPKVVTLAKRGYVPRVPAQPVLRWSRVRGATYYHVQLFRRGRRILAAWPLRPQLALRTTWRWGGRRRRLAPGRYRWYVWAGFGPRAAQHYRLLGRQDFIATRG